MGDRRRFNQGRLASRYSSRRFRKIRGLDALKAVARAVAVDRLDLGFVDILSTEGALDHPLSGPQEELYWRRELLASVEPPRIPPAEAMMRPSMNSPSTIPMTRITTAAITLGM